MIFETLCRWGENLSLHASFDHDKQLIIGIQLAIYFHSQTTLTYKEIKAAQIHFDRKQFYL